MSEKYEPDFFLDDSVIDEIKASLLDQVNYCEECGSKDVEFVSTKYVVVCKTCGYENKDPWQVVI